jgi:hypothetical protein
MTIAQPQPGTAGGPTVAGGAVNAHRAPTPATARFMIEEPLIFEMGQAETHRRGPAGASAKIAWGEGPAERQRRKGEIGLPGLSEPRWCATTRACRQKNYAIDLGSSRWARAR